MAKTIKLKDLEPADVPAVLKPDFYFDFKAHPFAHQALFEGCASVIDTVGEIKSYALDRLKKTIDAKKGSAKMLAVKCACMGRVTVYVEDGTIFEPAIIIGGKTPGRIYIEKGACVAGAALYVDEGDIYIGAETVVEPGVGIKGPTLIGPKNEIRQGAYFRGSIITGANGCFRGEIKNAVLMDEANFPHPSYVGDSLCGWKTHFGNQATTANLGIYYHVGGKDNVAVDIDGARYDLGVYKLGIVMGDLSQVGCNSVSDPGTFLGPRTVVYQLSRINKGFYGPDEVLKNKPIEHGIVERASFKPF